MRKIYSLLTIFILLVNAESKSQEYQLFFSDKFYIYEFEYAGENHFTVFKSDTLSMNGSDSVFFNYARTNEDNIYGPPASSFDTYSYSTWAGNKVIVNPNGETKLFNKINDSLVFRCQAIVGETWSLYNFPNGDQFLATVSSVTFDSVFTTMDSVKTITIQHIDSTGNFVLDSLNNFEFKLSRNYGLLATLEINHFPNRTTVYRLSGIDQVIGNNRISPMSLYNYEVGDIFHYYSYNHVSLSVNVWVYQKRFILSKNIISGGVSYLVGDSLYTITDNLGSPTSTTSYIVTTETYYNTLSTIDSLCGKLPYDFKFNSNRRYISSWHRSVNGRRAIYTVPCISRISPYIPSTIMRFQSGCSGGYCSFPGGSNWFVEGIGFFSHFATMDSSSSIYTCGKSLVYYQKGNETYGAPIQFPINTEIIESKLALEEIQIFPNPGNELVTIKNIGKNNSIIIYDSMLKEAKVNLIYGENQISFNCEGLRRGIYCVVISEGSSSKIMKLLISH
jgi:hypothetical protein